MGEECYDFLGDWESLPMDILHSILSVLKLPDLIRSSAACKAWREAAGEVYRPQLPWLGVMGTRNLYSFSDDCVYTVPPLPDDLASYVYGGTHEDWLIFTPTWSMKKAGCNRCWLYNPFSTHKISLPASPFDFNLRCIFSASPLDPNCMAALLSFDKATNIAVLHNPTGSEHNNNDEWKLISTDIYENFYLCDIAFWNQSLYAIGINGALMWVDTESSKIVNLIPSPPKPALPQRIKEKVDPKAQHRRVFKLLVLEDQLMMMCFIRIAADLVPLVLFKADFRFEKWEVVDHLNGHAIFFSKSAGMSCFTPMRPPKSMDIGGDCVYIIECGWDYHLDLLFRLPKQNTDECLEFKGTPSIWRSLPLTYDTIHFFLTPKPTFVFHH